MFCKRRSYRNWQSGDISIEELKRKVLQGSILIDVRSNQEYKEGHLEGAINIPDFEIVKRIEREVPKRNQSIIIYCQYGGRSKNTIKILKNMGYNNIYNLYGGLDNL